ncbi:MAG: aminoacyltransferase [Erysipelotrichaceae bacterium]|nr:aminoacyltransferase [Erysipelotrichaceae bacterium]
MILEEISCQEYQNFLDQQSHVDFLQSVEQGKRMAKQGWIVEYVQAKENGEIRAAAMLCMIPLMKIFRYCYIPRGYFCDYHDQKQIAEFTSLLKKHLSRRKVVYMEIDPVIILKERDKNGDIVEGGIDNSDVIEILKNNGYHHLPVKPGYDLARQCRYVSVLDLHPSADQLFKDLSYQTRQDIRTSEKYCVKVDSLDRNGLKMLDDMEKKTSERHHFTGMDMNFYYSVIDFYGEENVFAPYAYLDIEAYHNHISSEYERLKKEVAETEEILKTNPSVKKQKKLKTDMEYLNSLQKKLDGVKQLQNKHGDTLPLAAAFFIKYRDQMFYLVGASEYEYRTYKGPYAIQWHMIRKAKQLGCTRYNFYGISGYFKEGEEGYGVFDFKRGFNAVVEEYIGNFILPVKPAVYNIYNMLKKQN